MMQARFRHGIVWLALLASGGCELVADFDRSKIPTDRPDSSVTPPPPPRDAGGDEEDDGGTDASAADASDDDDAG